MHLNNFKCVLILLVLSIIQFPTSAHSAVNPRLDSLLIRLDDAIQNQDLGIKQKEIFIQKTKAQLEHHNLTSESQYLVYKQLTDEYEAYQSDSLKIYSQKRLEAAIKTANKEWIIDSKINMALVLAKTGFFEAAIDTLDHINKRELTNQQFINCYKTYSDNYLYWIEYLEGIDVHALVEKRQNVQDSLMPLLPINSYDYVAYYGTKYIESGIFDKAETLLYSILPRLKEDTRDFAVLTSILAYLYERKGDIEKQKEYLAISALAEIRTVITENTSLRRLALLLFNEGEIQRANIYIKKCMDDANYFNARLRNLQTSRILPIIDKAYQEDRAKQQKTLSILLAVISFLSLVLMLVIFFVIRQMQKLSKAQKNILFINNQLTVLNQN
jgi:hypothetical protein